MRWLCVLAVASLSTAADARAGAPAASTPWHAFRTPTAGKAQSVGGYSAGCVLGAVALPTTGDGFVVARPARHRSFGHPALVATIRDLGRRVKSLGLPPLSVGDLGQARGGPAPSGHASHQTGLDVDLFYVRPTADDATS